MPDRWTATGMTTLEPCAYRQINWPADMVVGARRVTSEDRSSWHGAAAMDQTR